jgi:predicted helicase
MNNLKLAAQIAQTVLLALVPSIALVATLALGS